MKKILISAAALSVLLLFFGCGHDVPCKLCALESGKEYFFTYTDNNNDFCFSGTLERTSDSVYRAIILAPEFFYGTEIHTSVNGVEIIKSGISADFSTENLPKDFFIVLISDTVKHLENGEYSEYSSDAVQVEYIVPIEKNNNYVSVKYDRNKKIITCISFESISILFEEDYQ